MEVILLNDIPNVGHEGDVIEVADGYARNYLIPQRLATQATAGALNELQQRGRAIEQREEQKRHDAQQLAERLREEPVVIPASIGAGGRLHGEVTPQQISSAVAEQFGVAIDRRDIDIPVPIREAGDYLISATLYKDVTAELAIHVAATGTEQVQQEESASPEETEGATA